MDHEQEERSAGLQRGYTIALNARKRVKAPPGDAQRAMAGAVRMALEAAVVEVLFSADFSEAFLDGLLLAARTLTAEPGQRRDRRGSGR